MDLRRVSALLLLLTTLSNACSDVPPTPETRPVLRSPSAPGNFAGPTPAAAERQLPRGVSEPPSWLGRRVLPQRPDGLGIARSTPRLLRDRRLTTRDVLAPPETDRFEWSIQGASRRVLKRSTWRPACPVAARDLAYVKASFWGFDRQHHTGELLLHRSVAREVVSVFRSLHRAHWPIEEMRITEAAELDAPPTGDGNNTGAFVCRPARLSSDWSEHAYGLAIDINPFHNPYVREDVVLPERALAYRDRSWRRPGMIFPGDVVTRAFARIGWGWGGSWSSSKDWMHFSRSGS